MIWVYFCPSVFSSPKQLYYPDTENYKTIFFSSAFTDTDPGNKFHLPSPGSIWDDIKL